MDMIRCIYTGTVHAPVEETAPSDAHRRTDLTPFDLRLLLSGPIQKGLLFHKPPNDAALIRRLETSLAATLRFFPSLAGRLSRIDDGTSASFSIDCNNAGAKFVHAAADSVTVSDIADAVYVPQIVSSFFADIGAFAHEGVSEPLLAAQVTELADGVFIGCSVNHAVADGTSFWHFFRSWSEICAGLETVSKPPLRRGLQGFGPVRIPLELLVQKKQAREGHALPELVERIYRFSKESIAELKAQANCEMGTDRISSLQAVLAHLWRCVLRSRQRVEYDEQVRLFMAIGARPRLPLPNQYFGNAVIGAMVTMKAGDVVGQNGVGQAAWEINKMVALHTQEKLKSILECWVENPILVNLLNLMLIHNSVMVSSSPRFNVYDNNFGWGRPIAVRNGVGNKAAGKITLFPGAYEDSIEIQACLLPQTTYTMEKDREFMDKVTN